MSFAADAAIFEEREEPGFAQSVALAAAVHVLLALVLFFGVRWQSKPPETIAVELWVPPPPVAVVEPPKPLPRVEPPPAPKPEPVVEKPDIALKSPPKPKPEPEKKKADPPKPKPEPSKAKPEPAKPVVRDDPFKKQMMEQLAREQNAIKVDQERARVLGELTASADAKGIADWVAKVRAKIRGNIVLPPDLKGNPEAVFEVVQLPTGEVLSVKLKKSSGVPALDNAIERAILKSSPLPKPDRNDLFQRNFELKYRPQD
jgi:colicin import membrane protein